MSYDLLSEPWEQIPDGYVCRYMFNYYPFTPLNEVLFFG